ncbi:acyl-CoA thioesterase [Paragemmobacter straminiformis]|uniref:Acyl-CoA thioesterase n=1 Tax=Paragemmobacter straminiformis TaxID=2045119 RepID=A0A842I9R9_9RHOB|nr:acyl-CoA thioesterase [Gemmobacter straminiformis]MBC2836341.1 acyl-CoA thioesterase [Gemmobacter straminiformis]
MYPFIRMAKELLLARRLPDLPLSGVHVSRHICWPWDLDPWVELNNGRTLTLYDLGRVPLGRRVGFHRALAAQGWGMAVAGNTTRYRRRVRAFDRITMHSRCIGWDARFFYIEQSMWLGGECASHMVVRSAVTSTAGIVPPARMLAAMGQAADSPPLPDWVERWIAAEAARPWPPAR